MKTKTQTFITPNYKINCAVYDAVLNGTHVLIGGTTGSGKSVLLNNLIEYLITNKTPNDIEFVFIDPKKVELNIYEKLPFTIIYADENETMLNALDGLIDIMERRFDDMKKRGLRFYDGTRIYCIIDELADLISIDKKAFSERLNKLARLARAANINLICCTQKPSRAILPAEFVAQFSTCVALRCKTAIESRQIIDKEGAEKLPQYGKFILKDANSLYHTCNVVMTDETRLKKIIAFWKNQNLKRTTAATAQKKHNRFYYKIQYKGCLRPDEAGKYFVKGLFICILILCYLITKL